MSKETAVATVAVDTIRIVYREQSGKLSARSDSALTYELGVSDVDEKQYIRIAGNEGSGSCSFEWIELSVPEELLSNEKVFSGSLLQKAFKGRSSNNGSYLAAILRTEGVIKNVAEKSTQLTVASFAGIKAKVAKLAKDEVDLHDVVAEEKAKREALRAQNLAKKTVTPSQGKEKSKKGTSKDKVS